MDQQIQSQSHGASSPGPKTFGDIIGQIKKNAFSVPSLPEMTEGEKYIEVSTQDDDNKHNLTLRKTQLLKWVDEFNTLKELLSDDVRLIKQSASEVQSKNTTKTGIKLPLIVFNLLCCGIREKNINEYNTHFNDITDVDVEKYRESAGLMGHIKMIDKFIKLINSHIKKIETTLSSGDIDDDILVSSFNGLEKEIFDTAKDTIELNIKFLDKHLGKINDLNKVQGVTSLASSWIPAIHTFLSDLIKNYREKAEKLKPNEYYFIKLNMIEGETNEEYFKRLNKIIVDDGSITDEDPELLEELNELDKELDESGGDGLVEDGGEYDADDEDTLSVISAITGSDISPSINQTDDDKSDGGPSGSVNINYSDDQDDNSEIQQFMERYINGIHTELKKIFDKPEIYFDNLISGNAFKSNPNYNIIFEKIKSTTDDVKKDIRNLYNIGDILDGGAEANARVNEWRNSQPPPSAQLDPTPEGRMNKKQELLSKYIFNSNIYIIILFIYYIVDGLPDNKNKLNIIIGYLKHILVKNNGIIHKELINKESIKIILGEMKNADIHEDILNEKIDTILSKGKVSSETAEPYPSPPSDSSPPEEKSPLSNRNLTTSDAPPSGAPPSEASEDTSSGGGKRRVRSNKKRKGRRVNRTEKKNRRSIRKGNRRSRKKGRTPKKRISNERTPRKRIQRNGKTPKKRTLKKRR